MYWVQSFLVSLSVAEYFFKTIALTASNYVSLGWLQLQSSFPRHPVCLFFSHFHAVFFCVFVPLDFQSWLQSPHAFSLNTSSLNVSLSWRITRSVRQQCLGSRLTGVRGPDKQRWADMAADSLHEIPAADTQTNWAFQTRDLHNVTCLLAEV